MPALTDQLFADVELSRRLERAEGAANARFVEARATLEPARGAVWIDVGGTYAMYDGVDSPLTQTFGLGLFSELTIRDLDAIETFFLQRGAAVHHEVSPLAGTTTAELLNERGYHPFEFTNILYRAIADRRAASSSGALHVRQVDPAEGATWAEVAAEGWSDTPGLADFVRDIGRVHARRTDTLLYVAQDAGTPIATAALSIHDDVALLAGASTVPRARGRGAQNALLDARLQAAAQRGCAIAMMGALPGSGSQRNAERQGFRVAYTRIKWRRA